MPAVRVPVHAQVAEIQSLLGLLVLQAAPEALPFIREVLVHLNKAPGVVPITARMLSLVTRAKNPLHPTNWRNALAVAIDDWAVPEAVRGVLRMFPFRAPGGLPKEKTAADWRRMRELARDQTG